MVVGKAAQLLIIAVHQRRVHRHSIRSGILLYPETEFHLSTDNALGNELSDFHLLLAIERGDTCVQVKLLGVERLDLYMNLLFLVGYDSLAVARH